MKIRSWTLVVALFAALAVCRSASAQEPAWEVHSRATNPLWTAGTSSYRDHSASETKKLAKLLALTPSQTVAVQPILADRLLTISNIMNDNSVSWKIRHERRDQVVAATDLEITALLSGTQRTRFESVEAHHPIARPDADVRSL